MCCAAEILISKLCQQQPSKLFNFQQEEELNYTQLHISPATRKRASALFSFLKRVSRHIWNGIAEDE